LAILPKLKSGGTIHPNPTKNLKVFWYDTETINSMGSLTGFEFEELDRLKVVF
jgi:hypothetical protein